MLIFHSPNVPFVVFSPKYLFLTNNHESPENKRENFSTFNVQCSMFNVSVSLRCRGVMLTPARFGETFILIIYSIKFRAQALRPYGVTAIFNAHRSTFFFSPSPFGEGWGEAFSNFSSLFHPAFSRFLLLPLSSPLFGDEQ
jgi:hypothetical protein